MRRNSAIIFMFVIWLACAISSFAVMSAPWIEDTIENAIGNLMHSDVIKGDKMIEWIFQGSKLFLAFLIVSM